MAFYFMYHWKSKGFKLGRLIFKKKKKDHSYCCVEKWMEVAKEGSKISILDKMMVAFIRVYLV